MKGRIGHFDIRGEYCEAANVDMHDVGDLSLSLLGYFPLNNGPYRRLGT